MLKDAATIGGGLLRGQSHEDFASSPYNQNFANLAATQMEPASGPYENFANLAAAQMEPAFRQLEMQPYKPAGATASSNDLSVRGAAGGSSKVKEADVEHLPRRQARNNGGSSMAAGSLALRQFQQALGGSRSAGNIRSQNSSVYVATDLLEVENQPGRRGCRSVLRYPVYFGAFLQYV